MLPLVDVALLISKLVEQRRAFVVIENLEHFRGTNVGETDEKDGKVESTKDIGDIERLAIVVENMECAILTAFALMTRSARI